MDLDIFPYELRAGTRMQSAKNYEVKKYGQGYEDLIRLNPRGGKKSYSVTFKDDINKIWDIYTWLREKADLGVPFYINTSLNPTREKELVCVVVDNLNVTQDLHAATLTTNFSQIHYYLPEDD